MTPQNQPQDPLGPIASQGSSDCLQGAAWWNNPHQSGTWQAYAWDKGHSAVRSNNRELMQ